MKNVQYRTLTIILVVIVLGLVAYIYFGNKKNAEQYTRGEESTSNALSADGVSKTIPDNAPEAPINKNTEDISAELTLADTIAQCTAAEKKIATDKKTEYQKGSLLVSFQKEVTFGEATAVIKKYHYDYSDKDGASSLFASYHVITASVPAGQEFTAECTLRQDSNVKNAILNTSFQIHD